LLEPQRTNIFEDGDYVAGTRGVSNGAIEYNDTTSPEGLVNGHKFYENTNTSLHFARLGSVGVDTYTFSAYMKASGRNKVLVTADYNNGAVFNVSTGAVDSYIGSGYTASVEDAGNGWYRCIATFTSSASATFYLSLLNDSGTSSYTGDGSSGIHIYGVQCEEGSYATSYIPTYGSSVTRVSELVYQSSGAIGNPTSWSLFFECARIELESTQDAITLEDSTGAIEQIRLHFDSPSNNVRFRDARNSFENIGTSLNVSKDTFFKGCLTSDGTTLKAYWNGALSGSRAVVNQHDVDRVFMFSKGFKTKQLLVFPTTLTEEEAIDLTTL
jgi:hypothetical protein